MQQTVIKWIAFVGVLVGTAWVSYEFASNRFDFSAMSTLIAALVVFLGLEVAEVKYRGGNPNDVSLFKSLIALLPPATVGVFYRTHDFGADFPPEFAEAMHRFAQDWCNPDHEFIDSKLEKERKRLYADGLGMSKAIAQYTVPNRTGHISVFPDRVRGQPRPEHILEETELLNAAARKFSKTYDAFIRLARRRLHVDGT